jgi:hypothetical protein
METDLHLDLARGLLSMLLDLLGRKPLKTWSTASIDLTVSLLRLVDQAVRHTDSASALVPLLDQIVLALGREGKRTPFWAPTKALRADLMGDAAPT